MARNNLTFRVACNRLLDDLAQQEPGATLGSEITLGTRVGASRTTIRAVLTHLAEAGVVRWEGRAKTLLRRPVAADYFGSRQTESPAERLERGFMSLILNGLLPPGSALNESWLARRFEVPVATVRTFLVRFEPFGLIEKQPNRSWLLKGFTRDFAAEMFEMRDLIEMRAIRAVLDAPQGGAIHRALHDMERRHLDLVARPEAIEDAFPALDAAFHRFVCGAADNRFFDDFARRISIIVHYHYQWNKQDENARNRAALSEHLVVIRAALDGDRAAAERAFAEHLRTARRNLMASVIWE